MSIVPHGKYQIEMKCADGQWLIWGPVVDNPDDALFRAEQRAYHSEMPTAHTRVVNCRGIVVREYAPSDAPPCV